MKLLAFGEILWDVFPNGKHIGGAPLNFAAHAAKQGSDAFIISALGNDSLGNDALEFLKCKNINTKYVKTSNLETGKCLVSLDEKGIPHYNLLSGVAWDDIDGTLDDDFDVLYFGTLSLRSDKNLESLRKILKSNNFEEIFVDVNIRPPFYSEKSIKFATEKATILKISDEELSTFLTNVELPLSEDPHIVAKNISDKYGNLKLIIITLGEKGAICFDVKAQEFYETKAVKTEVVSTVGAGDSFSASFICEYLKTKDISKSLSFASKVAAFVVSKTEAIPEYPTQF